MSPDAVAARLRDVRPELIVNAAAWTAVDAAEEQRDAAFRMNARGVCQHTCPLSPPPRGLSLLLKIQRTCMLTEGARLPEQLARFAANAGIPLIHYSSDYVYPGDGDTPWHEESPTGPLSAYGESKLAGDQAVAASGARHLIFGISWVYSARGNNFLKTMLRLGLPFAHKLRRPVGAGRCHSISSLKV